MVEILTGAACGAITIGVLLGLSFIVAVLLGPSFDRFAERTREDIDESMRDAEDHL
jgi:hypothetical protein